MDQYLLALKDVLENGIRSEDRTGVGTIRKSGIFMRFNLEEGFPLVTTKRVHVKSVIHELLWFLSGSTNVRDLQKHGVTIWDEWADENGDLGPVYGRQWRGFRGVRKRTFADGSKGFAMEHVDQVRRLIETAKQDMNSRRLVVSAWNPVEIEDMALPPCHALWQILIKDGKLDLVLFQRSGDMFLGVPFNIASYALLAEMIAHVLGVKPGEFIHTIADAHIYLNHLDQVSEQLSREPRPLPRLSFARQVNDIFDFRYEDVIIEGYDPHPPIKAEVAV